MVLRIKVFDFSSGFSESRFLMLEGVDLKSRFLILVGVDLISGFLILVGPI